MDRERGLLAGAPWWARVALINFPVAVSLFFMGQSTGVIPSSSTRTAEALNRVEAMFAKHTADGTLMVGRLTVALRVMCENAARDEPSRRNCANIQ